MKLEVGKKYITRDGRVTSPLTQSSTESFSVPASLFWGYMGEYNYSWTEKGEYESGDCEKTGLNPNLDLVEEHTACSVNSPTHYTQGNIECIDAIKAALGSEFNSFLQGNVIKYIWRMNHKNHPLQDCLKADWYLQRLIKELENDNSD